MRKNTFKFFVSKAKPYLKKHYGNARAGVSATVTGRKKGTGFEYDLHATIPKDTFDKGAKHLKKNKLLYELGASGVAGYTGAKIGQKKKGDK